jgi:hypothetical protein
LDRTRRSNTTVASSALTGRRENDGSYPRLLINSIDMKKMLDLVSDNRLDELAVFLAGEVRL